MSVCLRVCVCVWAVNMCVCSYLSWLHPLGVVPSEKLPREQEEHVDFLRLGCHIADPGSIKSRGVTGKRQRTDRISDTLSAAH